MAVILCHNYNFTASSPDFAHIWPKTDDFDTSRPDLGVFLTQVTKVLHKFGVASTQVGDQGTCCK